MTVATDPLEPVLPPTAPDPANLAGLWNAVYEDLRALAHARLRGGRRQTLLDTTVLVHESYLKLAERHALPVPDRQAFFAQCARTMRSVIVDLARQARARRAGGALSAVTLDTALGEQLAAPQADPPEVDEALATLARVEPRLAQVAEMRYFAGLTEGQIAKALQVHERTVRRDWARARLLLHAMLAH